MDECVLECLKRIYRKSVLKEMISQTEADMLAFLKKIDMLSVVEKIANAREQVSPETLGKSWRKLISFDEFSLEENATCSESVLNDKFVEQFAALSIELTISDIDGWFQADGPDYEHMDEQGIVDLVLAAEDEERDEEEDTDENTGLSTKRKMSYFARRGNANI